jgi:hypothetical protein
VDRLLLEDHVLQHFQIHNARDRAMKAAIWISKSWVQVNIFGGNIMANRLRSLWEWAAEKDATLQVRNRDFPVLLEKRLLATPYSRAQFFAKIARGEIGIYRGMPVHILQEVNDNQRRRVLLKALKAGFPRTETASVQKGPSRKRSQMTIPALIKCWEDERTVVSVTDLHFRETRFEKLIDTSALSDFNILCNDPHFAQEFIDKIEMMTLVISSKGNVTDSHTDDCDGTNHCFLGRKLWLAWDRVEGQRRGLQDSTRDDVQGQAAFEMRVFLAIRGARWFIINANETLFLPGNLAHKVVTLENYVGVGSFNVTLPGALRTLARWHLHGTTDIHRKRLLQKITKAVIGRAMVLHGESQKTQDRWGLCNMQAAVRQWHRHENEKTKRLLLSKPGFAPFIESALAC